MEIIIANIMTPRMRSLSDPILDNSLALLAGDLRSRGIQVKVLDGCNVNMYHQFSLSPINKMFRKVFARNMASLEKGVRPTKLSLVSGLVLDNTLQKYQNRQMEKWLMKVAQEVAREQVPFFGIKTWYGDAYGWAKKMVELVNEYSPETITICGGPQANIYHDNGAVLRYSNFDLAVYSVGKDILGEIIEAARGGKNKAERLELIKAARINNLIYRDGQEVRVNSLRECNFVNTIIPEYEAREGKVLIHNLVDGLGCPWNKCHFCPHKNVTPHYQMRPIADVMNEIRSVLRAGIGVFRFCGSDTPLKVGVKLAEAILAEDLRLAFSMFNRAVKGAKANYTEVRDSYRILIRAGLRAVFMGIETGNDQINDQVMNKNLNSEDINFTLKAIREAGQMEGKKCDTIMAFIHPTPLVDGVTVEQVMEDNLRLIQEVQPSSVLITPAGVFPQTAWYDNAAGFGFEMDEKYLFDLMHCEYILSKPPQLWKNIPNLKLHGHDTAWMFKESSRFRQAVNRLGVPTGIGDEVMLMFSLVGYSDNQSLIKANGEFFLDVTACTYGPLKKFYDQFNAVSRDIALSNFHK